MSAGILIVFAGIWLVLQVTKGDLVQRIGIG